MTRRTIRRMILGTLCLGLLIAAAVAYARRTAGTDHLDDVLARHRDAGLGAGPGDLRAEAPRADPDRQERLHAWWKGDTVALHSSLPANRMDAYAFDGDEDALEAMRTDLAAWRVPMSELEALMEEGPLTFSAMGYIRQDLPEEGITLSQAAAVRFPNIMALRRAVDGLGQAALVEADSRRPLVLLDRLEDGLAPSGALIDALIAVAIHDMRDTAYLRAQVLGVLPDDLRDAWRAEAPSSERIAEGVRGERLLFVAPLAEELRKGGALSTGSDWIHGEAGMWDRLRGRADLWLDGPADLADLLDVLAEVEESLRDPRPATGTRARYDALLARSRLLRVSMANLPAVVTTGVHSRARHRAMRLVSHLVELRRAGEALPATEDELVRAVPEAAALLAEGPLDLRLRYERPAEHVPRVSVDPASRVPAMAEIDLAESPYGQPPRDQLPRWVRLGVEVDLSRVR